MRSVLLPASILLSAAVGLSACTDAFVTEVDIDLPDNARQLVIEATVRPDDTSYVYVTRTRDLNETGDSPPVAGAAVTLSVGGEEVARFGERAVSNQYLLSSGSNESLVEYFALVPAGVITPGTAVTLRVEAADGEVATATEVSPPPAAISDAAIRAGDFDARLTLELLGEGEGGHYLLTGDVLSYRPTDYDSLGSPTGFDTIVDPARFSTGEDIDYVGYGERFPARSVGGEAAAVVVDVSGNLYRCTGSDCADRPEPVVRLRAVGLNPLAADYYEALQQFEQTDGNPFVEPVALPSAFEGARGMLIMESVAAGVEVRVE